METSSEYVIKKSTFVSLDPSEVRLSSVSMSPTTNLVKKDANLTPICSATTTPSTTPSSTPATSPGPLKLFFKANPILFMLVCFPLIASFITGSTVLVLYIAENAFPSIYQQAFRAMRSITPIFAPANDDDGSFAHQRYGKQAMMTYGLHIIMSWFWSYGLMFQMSTGSLWFNKTRNFGKNNNNNNTATVALPASYSMQQNMKKHRLYGMLWAFASLCMGISGFGFTAYHIDYTLPWYDPSILTFQLLAFIVAPAHLISLGIAVRYAFKRNFRLHQVWVWRHIMIGLSVGYGRWILYGIDLVCRTGLVQTGGCHVGAYHDDFSVHAKKIIFGTTFWVSGVTCVLLGEVVIRRLQLLRPEVKRSQ